MRCLAVFACLLLVSACASQRPMDDPLAKLYHQRSPGQTNVAVSGQASELAEKAIVILRVKYEAPNDEEFKAITVNFTTQSVDQPYSGRVINGESGFDSAYRFSYASDENVFLAVAVEPGIYRYINSGVGNPIWVWSRFSPTRRIEFTARAGEAVYVGDLKVFLRSWEMDRSEDAFGNVSWTTSNGAIDYNFEISADEAAARRFYDSLDIKDPPSLSVRPMSNEAMPSIERYENWKCNGFYYPAYSARGFCK